MKHTKISLFLCVFIIAFACKKKKIEELPPGNEPIFKAQGILDGEEFSIIAGENNAFMYSFTEKINGVNKFTGKLSDNSTEIEIGIFDGNIDSPSISFEQLLADSLRWDIVSGAPLVTLSKDDFPNAFKINSIQWFSDNTFIGMNTVPIFEPGKYSILALVTFDDGKTASLRNDLIVGYTTNANFILRFNLFPDGDLNTWINVSKGTVSSVKWTIDGEELEETDENIINNIDEEEHEISATVIFTNGVVRTKSIHVDGSLTGNNIPDFSDLELTPSNVSAPPRDYKTKLVVRKNGIEYRSDFIGNNSNSIKIKEIKYYGVNGNGKNVYKLSAAILTNLKNMSTSSVESINFETIFGIEIP